jgi:hypothetical protein
MIRVLHYGPLLEEDRRIIEAVTADFAPVVISDDRNDLPEFHYIAGGIAVSTLAYLAITFIGIGAGLLLKSFLQSLGSELGKTLIEHFSKKKVEPHIQSSQILLYEVNPRIVVLIPMISPAEPGFADRMKIPELIDKIVSSLPASQNAILRTSFDVKTNSWKIQEVFGILALHYTSTEGRKALSARWEKERPIPAREIAQWMHEEYKKHDRLVQSYAAGQIRRRFGKEYVYRNKNGNWGINKPILDEFRKLTGDDTVWSRSSQLWRKRRASDPPSKRMVK